jgi:hypothetical protein
VNAQRCRFTLEGLSLYHDDPDWVFNTVRMLHEFGWLNEDTLDKLAEANQIDYDLWQDLNDMGYVEES